VLISTPKQLHILITRPEPKALVLATYLTQTLPQQLNFTHPIQCTTQPLFDYQPLASQTDIKQAIQKTTEQASPIFIFVSVAAVKFAQQSYALTNWLANSGNSAQIFAVGQATQKALQTLGFNQVICPEQENSEGLLALPSLQASIFKQVALKQGLKPAIIIVRGNGGREHLKEQLTMRGAQVCYIESYQRVWRTFPKAITKQWQDQKINCIVVTSNDLLKKLVQLIKQGTEQSATQDTKQNSGITHSAKSLPSYWQKQCLWIVASQRIADNAKALGLEKIINANGANEYAISTAIEQEIMNP